MAHQVEAEMIPCLGTAVIPGVDHGGSDPKGWYEGVTVQ